MDNFSTSSTHVGTLPIFPQKRWTSFPHYPQNYLSDNHFSTKAVDEFSTSSTDKEKASGYPQKRWISFPHHSQSNRPSGDLSTKVVDKFSTSSTGLENVSDSLNSVNNTLLKFMKSLWLSFFASLRMTANVCHQV